MSTVLPDDTQALKRMLVRSQAELLEARLMVEKAKLQLLHYKRAKFGASSERLTELAQLDWNVPDYSTLSRRQKTLRVAITACPSRGGLHLLIDSTGVKILGESKWKIRKHGADYRHQWRKVHLGVDAQTLEI